MKKLLLLVGLACPLLVGHLPPDARAGGLSGQLGSLFGSSGLELDVNLEGENANHRAHFSNTSFANLSLLVQQMAANAADFPAISTAPGFTYRYNPDVLSFERSSTSLGSVFVERPQTLGRGKFDLGVSYLYADFDELNGQDLDDLSFTGLEHNDCCSGKFPPPSPGVPAFEEDTADIFFHKFNLESHVLSFFATYGLMDHWDVNFLLPIIYTSLDVGMRAVLNNESGEDVHFFDTGSESRVEVRSIDDDAFGVGDLQLRTKYHLLDTEGVDLAAGLAARFPTGDEDDFQGLGDYTLTPGLAFSFEHGRLEGHASSGVEINFDDSDRSRIRYGAGVALQIIDELALLVDVVGSSSLKTDRISVTARQFVNVSGNPEAIPSEEGIDIPDFRRFNRTFSTDIVDLAVGFKANFYGSMVGFFNVFIPLTDDGIRADFIPTAGIEMSF